MGAENFRFVSVMSFSNLSDKILAITGNLHKKRLNEAAKVTLVRRAVGILGEEIVHYRRMRNQIAFHRLVASVIDECKEALASPEKIKQLSLNAKTAGTRIKLHEIALIYRQYEELLSDRYEDTADHLSVAAMALKSSGYLTDKTIYIDGFTGFSGPEYKLIESMVEVSKEITVTLLGDKGLKDTEVFSTVRATSDKLSQLSKGTTIETIYIPPEASDLAPGIAALERYLLTNDADAKGELDGLYLIKERDAYSELNRVATEIVELIRNHNYRFSEIAIIARNIESYRSVIARTFRLYEIPFFADWTKNESYSGIASFIKATLSLIEEPTAEQMLTLLKTSLTSISASDIAVFENYIYVWNLGRNRLNSPFTNNPDGYNPEGSNPKGDNPKGLVDTFTKEQRERLQRAEETRVTVTAWVKDFVARTKDKTASEIIKQIYLLMTTTGAFKTLETRKEADNAVDLLENLHFILKDEKLEVSEIIGICEVLMGQTYIGRIPPMIEQVQVGAANRIRTNQPKVVFVLGILEGVFPATDFDFPLLSHKERGYILENGVELEVNFDNLLKLEQLYFYNALTCGNERVYLSTPTETVQHELLEISESIAPFLNENDIPTAPTANNHFSSIVNEATAKIAYILNPLLAKDIKGSGLFSFCSYIDSLKAAPRYELLNLELLKSVFGETIELSQSRIDKYMNCPFSYFLRYMLSIEPIRMVEMSYIEAGIFIHYILEQVFKKTKGKLTSYTESDIVRLCNETVEMFEKNILSSFSDSSSQLQYQLTRLKNQAVRLVTYLKNEQQHTDFIPLDFELSIDDEGEVVPRSLNLLDGTTIKVNGKIDRVDIASVNDENYLRVLDYKTGTRSFSLDDVVYGLNMQMLIYMFTIIENGYERYGDVNAAGVLYMPSDPPVPSIEDGYDRVKEAYRMDGLLLSEEDVVEAMEYEGQGAYIPLRKNKKGFRYISDMSASSSEMDIIKRHIDNLIINMGQSLKAGDIKALPTLKNNRKPCDYCDYTASCRSDRISNYQEIQKGAHKILKEGGMDD